MNRIVTVVIDHRKENGTNEDCNDGCSRSAKPALLGLLLLAALCCLPRESAGAQPDRLGKFKVGHSAVHIMLTGTLGEPRPIDIEVWYPADGKAWKAASPSLYTSRLNGVPLLPDRWDPLSWEVASPVARDDTVIDSHGPFPVVVFSHGSTGVPIDYAFTLEHVASHGYIVVGPWHTGNTQDDVRVDFINAQAGVRLLRCLDELPPPCSDASAAKSIADRVRDITAVLDALPALFGHHVDVTRVAVMGHSRGTLTGLAAAGGSTAFKIPAEPRVKAVLGFAIGVPSLTFSLDLAGVTVPTLLVAGGRDRFTPKEISEAAFGLISSTEKGFVVIENAEHRSFDSTVCAQMQSAGAIALFNPRAILDLDTLTGLLIRNPTNGTTLDIRSYDSFVNPVDITGLVAFLTGFVVTADNVPRAGVDSAEVHRLMSELAVSFLDAVLDDRGDGGIHFTRFLSPKFLLKNEANISRAEFVGSEHVICPPGQGAECGDE